MNNLVRWEEWSTKHVWTDWFLFLFQIVAVQPIYRCSIVSRHIISCPLQSTLSCSARRRVFLLYFFFRRHQSIFNKRFCTHTHKEQSRKRRMWPTAELLPDLSREIKVCLVPCPPFVWHCCFIAHFYLRFFFFCTGTCMHAFNCYCILCNRSRCIVTQR